jgi:hypothetical protein
MKLPRNWPFLFFAPQGILLFYFIWTSVVPSSYTTENNVTFTYRRNRDSISIIKADASAAAQIAIPATIGKKQVTSILENAFADCISLTEISIPISITRIGKNAFTGCTNLILISFEGDAPESAPFLNLSPKAKIQITPQATGFGTSFGGLPVVIHP